MSNNSPASPAEIANALRALFTAFPTDRAEGPGFAATYHMAIEGRSLRAIEGAVRRIISGEADDIDRRFLPTPAQLGNVVRYLEKLYAPVERKLALPSPDDLPAEDDAAAWERRRQLAEAAKARFAPPASPVMKLMTEAEFDTWSRDEMARVRKESAEGKYTLSPAARATFTKAHLDTIARPDPSEEFDAWDTARLSTPPRIEDAA